MTYTAAHLQEELKSSVFTIIIMDNIIMESIIRPITDLMKPNFSVIWLELTGG